jgi:vitamin B12/bleomycin/antimicrobial peptide transport system ATP-binding/permease protein
VVERLRSLIEALEKAPTTTGEVIEIVKSEGGLAYERLTLLSSTNGSPLLKDLSISIPFGTRVLLTGSNAAARALLFRATAGVSTAGAGRIILPDANDILFLSQRPYLPPGTLRQVLEPDVHAGEISDDRIFRLLRQLNLEQVLTRADGLDAEQEWETLLSLREQQLLAVIHILLAAPRFAFLDQVGTGLDSDQVHKILHMLSESSIAYINNGEANDSLDLYDAVLECEEGGGRTWAPVSNRA